MATLFFIFIVLFIMFKILVTRDIFYTGNNIQERCTVISRIAPTFIRFGSFEIFKGVDRETGRKGPSFGRVDILRTLTDYCIRTFYPEVFVISFLNFEL